MSNQPRQYAPNTFSPRTHDGPAGYRTSQTVRSVYRSANDTRGEWHPNAPSQALTRSIRPQYEPNTYQSQPQHAGQAWSDASGSSSTSRQTYGASNVATAEGYTWSIGNMEKNSQAFHGLSTGARLEPAPKGQNVQFKVGTMTDHSRMMGGVITDAKFDSFFGNPSSGSRA